MSDPPEVDNTAGLQSLSAESGAPVVDLASLELPLIVLDTVREDYARRYQILPLRADATQLFVAMADPNDAPVKHELEFLTGRKVVAYAAPRASLKTSIEAAYEARRRGEAEWHGARVGQVRAHPPAPDPAGVPVRQADVGAQPPAMRAPFGSEVVPPSSGSSQERRSSRPYVLVVDDEPVIGRIVHQALAQRGYDVTEANSGAAALRAIKEREPDVLLLDAMLPDIHGFDVCRRLKESRRYHDIPIVMMTAVYKGWRMAADLRDSYGVAGFIEKPFDIPDVVRQIESALERRPPGPRTDEQQLSDEARRLYDVASQAYQTGDLDSAATALGSAIGIDPLNAALRHQLGLVQARRGQDYAAIQELEVAVELEPERFPSLRNLAILYQRRGFRRKACELWERALAQAPDAATKQEIKDVLVSLL